MPPDKSHLDRIDVSFSAQEFFSKYVSKRKPVVIKGLIDDAAFKGRKWTDLSYLAEKAGDVEVTVEPIHPTANQYGTDIERISVPFRDFLKSLGSADGPHPYLTTQYADEDPDAETVFPPPTNALRDDFPVVPRMMGNLFLQQVNLWLGKSKNGSSSGLHHDFHDNLYCLLQGRKRFVLFPPSEVKNLSPYGTLHTLHPNGLIAYKDIPVRADGLSNRAACRARVRVLEHQIEVLKAKRKGKGKGKTQGKEVEALIEARDRALDELAEIALDEHGEDDDVDDFDALMGGLEDGGDEDDFGAGGPSNLKDSQSENEEEEVEWKGIGHSDDGEDSNWGSRDDDEEEKAESGESPSEPSSFSRIPTAHLHQHLDIPTTAALPADFRASAFPQLYEATAPYVVELSADEMLYLPASWWHEVTSTSSGDTVQKNGDGVHMAFNYWFYPPDALDSFEAPYADSLVWGYLRDKAGVAATDRVQVGKRGREKGSSESSKKARH